ncbi:MAG TPA: HepT-like ribonuclease domain-containing protein [Tepidisphaeraceae bacterium]|nr:HepT-like ribonuclease domain-containing protein [Tepidisphaeraceae bacterium]
MQLDARKLLFDMQQAVQRITRFTGTGTFDSYLADEMMRSAVERQFGIIGEALSQLNKIDPQLAQRITDYRKIVGFRNVIIHGYDAISDAVTWDIITSKLPVLAAELDQLLV